jgi:transposase
MERRVHVGLDVHRDTITIAAFVGDEPQPNFQKTISNTKPHIKKHFKKLAGLGEIHACYEAGFSGFELYRYLKGLGYRCDVIAPTLIPKGSGERVKNDRKDAEKLAKLLRANLLTPVAIPTVETERVRGYIRLRYQVRQDLQRTRQRILKFLHTRGLVFRGSKSNWTNLHRKWLCALDLEGEDELVLSEHLCLMSYLETRLEEINRRIEALAKTEQYAAIVGRLKCFKGIDTLAAMVIAAEVGDITRFASPRELMNYTGLTPSERSSGNSEIRGPITKCGNDRLRHVLVEAAWQQRNRPVVGRALQARHEGQPKEVVAYAFKAMRRLHRRYWALASRMNANMATAAVARELAGFVWGMMRLEAEPQSLAG